MNLTKPVFIHIIGLEGCGHHGIFPIFENILKDKYNNTNTKLYFRNGLRPFINGMYYENKPKEKCIRNMREFLEKNSNSIIVDDDSYPSYVYRTIYNQWDFEEIYFLLESYCTMKYVYLKRNIFNTINSHPRLDGGLIQHAEKLSEINQFIQKKISNLKHKGIDITYLNYDNINDNAEHIRNITGCDLLKVEYAIGAIFRKSSKNYKELLNDNEINEIKALFRNGV